MLGFPAELNRRISVTLPASAAVRFSPDRGAISAARSAFAAIGFGTEVEVGGIRLERQAGEVVTGGHAICSAANSVLHGAITVNSISANDLKTKGVGAIEQALADQPEASVTVRGQAKYVVMSHEHYVHLRECELEAALAESKADLDAGRFVRESVDQHLRRLAKLAV